MKFKACRVQGFSEGISMNEFNTYEYVVAQKSEGKWKVRRVLLVIGYIVFVLGLLSIGIFSRLLVPLLALTPIAVWILVFCTWRYVSLEYEYNITSGVFTLSNIYGGKSRKKLLEVQVKDLVTVAPYNYELPETVERADETIRRFAPEKEYVAVSSFDSPDVYYALYTDKETEEKVIIWFEATSKALKVFRFYNAPATVISQVRF